MAVVELTWRDTMTSNDVFYIGPIPVTAAAAAAGVM